LIFGEKLAVSEYPKIPVEATADQISIMSNALIYSMTTLERMWALVQSYEYVVSKNIPGDFVECGVWKGGNLILLSALQETTPHKRMILGFDTFSGMTEPSDADLDYRGIKVETLLRESRKFEGSNSIHALASLELVQENLKINNSKNVNLIKGDVLETLLDSRNIPAKISILRLDTDWYESTKLELEILFPVLSPGGILIIDDYGHYKGARRAVDEYFKNKKVWMHYIDYSCRLIVKEL
jgi:hypothetical protein